MQLLVIVIEREEHLRPILDEFFEAKLPGATVLDSMGLGHMIADHIPLFSHFAELSKGDVIHNKTIFTVIEEEEELEQAIEIVERIAGDLREPETGMLFTLPVNRVRGFKRRREE